MTICYNLEYRCSHIAGLSMKDSKQSEIRLLKLSVKTRKSIIGNALIIIADDRIWK